MEARRGSARVPNYRTETRAGFGRFHAGDYSIGKRVLRSYADLADAKRHANLIADNLAGREHAALKMTDADRPAYVPAEDVPRPLDVPLLVAVTESAEARRLLPDGKSLRSQDRRPHDKKGAASTRVEARDFRQVEDLAPTEGTTWAYARESNLLRTAIQAWLATKATREPSGITVRTEFCAGQCIRMPVI